MLPPLSPSIAAAPLPVDSGASRSPSRSELRPLLRASLTSLVAQVDTVARSLLRPRRASVAQISWSDYSKGDQAFDVKLTADRDHSSVFVA